jgi:hypothetical protein
MKRLIRFYAWSVATKQRFIWIFGVLYFGGGCWTFSLGWGFLTLKMPTIQFVDALIWLATWLAAGYLWGSLMWRSRAIQNHAASLIIRALSRRRE